MQILSYFFDLQYRIITEWANYIVKEKSDLRTDLLQRLCDTYRVFSLLKFRNF